MDNQLPLEILYMIAETNLRGYRAMIAFPEFARSLTMFRIFDFMIRHGCDCVVRNGEFVWSSPESAQIRVGNSVIGEWKKYIPGLDDFWFVLDQNQLDEWPADFDNWFAYGQLHRNDGLVFHDNLIDYDRNGAPDFLANVAD